VDIVASPPQPVAPDTESPRPIPTPEGAGATAEERVSVASQRQLMWWRFRKHRLAIISSFVILMLYTVVIFADFFAYSDPYDSDANRAQLPPQGIHLFHEGQFAGPFVYGIKGDRDATFKKIYVEDRTKVTPLRFFATGFPYKLLGLIPSDIHLLGVAGARAEETFFLAGTDVQGRDLFSRIVYATRTSLTVGLAGVALSLFLGVLLGGLSGYFGGIVDTVVQRLIEILGSVPAIPLWMGLAAAMPSTWDVIQVYFAITVLLAVLRWPRLARQVRGKMMSLRNEDFVMAAELAGAGPWRVIFVHLVPLFLSHIIAVTTLALPEMIIAETSLSFLGLGLRPPAISWGVLLQQAQNIQTVALAGWLMLPAVPVIISILAFNFLGDGLRDAADPYGI
jgi:peptide/nickel transport system permease protein